MPQISVRVNPKIQIAAIKRLPKTSSQNKILKRNRDQLVPVTPLKQHRSSISTDSLHTSAIAVVDRANLVHNHIGTWQDRCFYRGHEISFGRSWRHYQQTCFLRPWATPKTGSPWENWWPHKEWKVNYESTPAVTSLNAKQAHEPSWSKYLRCIKTSIQLRLADSLASQLTDN